MQIDIRGELRYSAYSLTYKDGTANPVFLGKPDSLGAFNVDEIDHAYLRVQGARPANDKERNVGLRIYFNNPGIQQDETKDDYDHRIGELERPYDGLNAITQNYDAFPVVERILEPERQCSLQVVSNTMTAVNFQSLELTVFTRRR
jgi:hypothetical protein